ncbi:hypothetical protein CHS0354_001920 [Potamilus streckersoni]|uniref:Phospholipase ABHD3 n=1 Tax=Potamilus streckersoni TaxID=2493646 RepID=A0AAE0SC36_9BIVA|nr:hypothetical protein CHS0354_001920 [Potamilus streckersoni]
MQIIKDIADCFQSVSSLHVLIGFIFVYLVYYILFVVKKPSVFCHDEMFRRFLLDHCPMLHEKFWPTVWCFESRAQTIMRGLIMSAPAVEYESEILTTPDGGQIKLDWMENDNSKFPDRQYRPTVILLPGLTGSSQESYVLHFVQEAAKHGFRTVVFNNRGNGGARLLTPRTYCAANTDDMALVVAHVKDKYPDSPLMGAGISLGGMLLLSYMAKMGKDCGLLAGMVVSIAWNVFESVLSLEQPYLNKYVLNRTLARNLVKSVKTNLHVFEPHLENLDHVLQASTIREFDDRFTTKIFGYESWEHYYREACLHDKVHALEVPVLCLSAADDPFSPHHAIPVKEAESNDNIAIVITSHGGHIGFLEGLFPRHRSYMDRLFSQFSYAVFTHGSKYLKRD